jgi:hypothetical protein
MRIDASQLPDYIPRDGRQSYITPIRGERSVLRTFLLPCLNRPALVTLVDRYLNRPWIPYQYRPLTSHVALTFGTLLDEYPVPPSPDSTLGHLIELNVSFWVAVVAHKREFGVWVPHHLAFYLPYLFVNNGIVLTSGRGTYGFPKQIGFFIRDTDPTRDLDDLDQDPRFNRLDTYVLSPQQPETKLARRTLLRILPPPDLPEGQPQHDSAVQDLIARLTRPGHLLEDAALDLVKRFTPSSLTWVFLKQFRDAVMPEKACYQAVLEAESTLQNLHSVHEIPGPMTLEITTLDSHRPAFELGLVPAECPFVLNEVHRVEVELALSSEFDFVLQNAAPDRVWAWPGE